MLEKLDHWAPTKSTFHHNFYWWMPWCHHSFCRMKKNDLGKKQCCKGAPNHQFFILWFRGPVVKYDESHSPSRRGVFHDPPRVTIYIHESRTSKSPPKAGYLLFQKGGWDEKMEKPSYDQLCIRDLKQISPWFPVDSLYQLQAYRYWFYFGIDQPGG